MRNNLKNKVLQTIAALAMICTTVLQGFAVPAFAQESAEIIDDYDSSFVYSSGNANNGGWEGWKPGDSDDPSESEHWSNTSGSYVTIHFTGNKIELYGKKAPNHRKFSVQIDNGKVIECDAYAAQKTDNNSLLYSSQAAGIVLNEGSHEAKVTILDQANPEATDVLGMNIAYAKIYHGENAKKYTIIEDSNMTSKDELFKIKYIGDWGGGDTHPEFHGGTEHWSNSNGSYQLKFIGTKVEIFGTKAPNHGQYPVSIDGEKVGVAMGESSSRKHQQLLFSSEELENKEHTLKVEAEQDKAIQVDYIKVYHDEMGPSKLSFEKKEWTMGPNANLNLKINIEPWVATTENLKWESSNEEVAIVKNGKVTSKEVKEKSTTTIKVSVVDNEDVFAETTITVDPEQSLMNVYVGDEKKLDLSEQYDTLSKGSGNSFQGTAWIQDQLNSKIIVTTKSKEAKKLAFTVSDFINENNQVLDKNNIEINWLKEVKSKVGRNANGPTKDFPAIIHKGGAKDLAANKVAFAWVKINIPEGTQPGTYRGTITATAENQKPVELDYEIEVLNIEQPALDQTGLQIWQHPFAVANYYLGLGKESHDGISTEIREDFYFSPEHFNLMRKSMKEYASIGGHDAVANVVEEAWNHQSYYNDLSMVKWTKKSDGTWSFDYTWYDQWIEFMIECGVINPTEGIGKIKSYSIVPWNNQIAYYDEAKKAVDKKSFKPGSEEFNDVWSTFLKDFMKHSKEKGWFDITYISMDERSISDLEPAVYVIESVKDKEGNHFKISSCLNYSAPEYYDFTDRIHDISINLDNCSLQQTNELSEHRRKLGLNTTFYSCTGNYPSNFIISDPADNYWTMWYTMTLGTDGYLRWAWDNYVYDMHEDVTYRYWEPGDGWFIYPIEREEADMSKDVSFYSTPKYELFKQGIRDVEKAKYLMKQNDQLSKKVDDLVKSLKMPSKGNYYGSAVPANEEQRELVHSETKRMIDGINALARAYTKENKVNKDALQESINKKPAKEEKDYTVDSWRVYQEALKDAKAVMEDEKATQKSVDIAKDKLDKALNDLQEISNEHELVVDREALNRLAKENEKALKNGTYAIRSAINKDYVLDVKHGNILSGTNVQLYENNGTDAQKFKVSHDQDGYVVLTNVNSGKVIDVDHAKAENGTNIQQYGSNDTYAQKWIAIKDGNAYKLVSALNEEYVLDLKYAEVKNESNIQLYKANDTTAQRWIFDDLEKSRKDLNALAKENKSVLKNGTYTIRSAINKDYVLDVKHGNILSGTNVQLYENNGTDAQKFKVSHDQDGYVVLTNVNSGKVIDVDHAKAENGTNIQQYGSNDTYAQKWIAIKDGNAYKLVSALNEEYVLDLKYAEVKNESNIQLYKANDTTAQRWVFKSVQ